MNNEYGIYPYFFLAMGHGGNFIRVGWLSFSWTNGYFIREAKKRASDYYWEVGDWLFRISWSNPHPAGR
jgi:hypothetical protein